MGGDDDDVTARVFFTINVHVYFLAASDSEVVQLELDQSPRTHKRSSLLVVHFGCIQGLTHTHTVEFPQCTWQTLP